MNTILKLLFLILLLAFGIALFLLGFSYESFRTFFSVGRFKATEIALTFSRKRKRS